MASCLLELGVVATSQGQPARAARLLSAADSLRDTLGVPLRPAERAAYERAVLALQRQLGATALASAWAEGRTLTVEQALADALAGEGSLAMTGP